MNGRITTFTKLTWLWCVCIKCGRNMFNLTWKAKPIQSLCNGPVMTFDLYMLAESCYVWDGSLVLLLHRAMNAPTLAWIPLEIESDLRCFELGNSRCLWKILHLYLRKSLMDRHSFISQIIPEAFPSGHCYLSNLFATCQNASYVWFLLTLLGINIW